MEKVRKKTRDWEIRKELIVPIIRSLLTAFILFLFALLLKEPIYNAFKPKPKVKNYPLYCIAEPYSNDKGFLIADLFIINLKADESFDEEELKSIIMESDPDRNIRPYIEITSIRDVVKIRDIKPDNQFNESKGRLEITAPKNNDKNWIIRVKEISRKAILKLIIVTDYKDKSFTRDAKGALPFDINYPGK